MIAYAIKWEGQDKKARGYIEIDKYSGLLSLVSLREASFLNKRKKCLKFIKDQELNRKQYKIIKVNIAEVGE
jgi:hypothetical protein